MDILQTAEHSTYITCNLTVKGISVCKWSVLVSFKCLKCVSRSLIFTHKHTMFAELSHEDLAWYWEGLGQHLVKGHLRWGEVRDQTTESITAVDNLLYLLYMLVCLLFANLDHQSILFKTWHMCCSRSNPSVKFVVIWIRDAPIKSTARSQITPHSCVLVFKSTGEITEFRVKQ